MTQARTPELSFEAAYAARRVLVTGHTGFKGSWLSLWLSDIGAEVHGISLAPDTTPNLYDDVGLGSLVNHNIQDVRDRDGLTRLVAEINPEIVFHLAAQPLVRRSYDLPLDTFETNIMGTAYLLESCRRVTGVKAIVCVTTDKVYENNEWVWAYRERDRLGGKDPYSASKAAAEIVVASYRDSFMSNDQGPALATARGGNVVGGGDWSDDRLVPDLVRAIGSDRELNVRNPNASRPWQHVLSLCHGYLQLADRLIADPASHVGAWNFGPDEGGTVSVQALLNRFERAWKLPQIVLGAARDKPESQALAIDSAKARQKLGWLPAWNLEETLTQTAEWYREYYLSPTSALDLTRSQTQAYRDVLASRNEDN